MSNVEAWFVNFWPKDQWWHLYGRFSHVSALGYSPSTHTWILYDVQNVGTTFRVAYEHDDVEHMFGLILPLATVLQAPPVAPQNASLARFMAKGPFSCVSATKHLLGLPTAAVTPSGLFRYMRRIGCEVVSEPGTCIERIAP